ncbi:MAG TPA: lysylphosphatidylglycerol synthase transmembrane domain-containing protein [Acidimicrobiales bacterium]|nr:lysylphosphatidylglycerol synthase transmembrane domain-containing protein [Acidimicrobiales bacterium]
MDRPPEPPTSAARRAARPRGTWSKAWPYLRFAVGIAAVGVAAWAVSGKTEELAGVTGYLRRLRWEWVALAVAAEATSYLALSSLERRLLRSGGVRVPAGSMFGITLAGSAIQNSFPGGSVVYLAYVFRQYRRWNADDLLAGWVIVAFNVVAFAALAAVSAVGLALAASLGTTYDLVEAILGILLFAMLCVLAVTERQRVVPHVTRLVRLSQRLVHRPDPSRPAAAVVQGWTDELAAVSPTPGVWARSAVMGLAYWLADLSCLTISFLAVGVGIPWRGLLLAYGAGQLAAVLPVTPGGLGAVEGSITVALVTFGGGAESTVAAVLIYRLVSFWLVLPVGWSAWGMLTLAGRGRRPLPAAPGTAGHVSAVHARPAREVG